MTLQQVQEEIIEEFSVYEDWMDKYAYIIELGREVPPLEEAYKKEENLVRGCQSRVWLQAENNQDKLHFKADSEAMIAKGLVALVMRVLNDRAPEEIVKAEIYFAEKIGLKEHLSPNRSNGLASMIKQMKAYALAYSALPKTNLP
jgi:cysteine desulfuration protein SufE